MEGFSARVQAERAGTMRGRVAPARCPQEAANGNRESVGAGPAELPEQRSRLMVWPIQSEQQHKALYEIEQAHSPRIVAVVGGALLDQSLRFALEYRMRRDKDTRKKLFRENGPLGGLQNKIDLGYLLHMYDARTQLALSGISEVRNLFAHHLDMKFGATDQRMVKALEKLTLHDGRVKYPSPFWDGDTEHVIENLNDARTRFLVNLKLCLILLTKDQLAHEPDCNTPTNIKFSAPVEVRS
jgi:hypothetical protein